MKIRNLFLLITLMFWATECKKDVIPPDPQPSAPDLYQTKLMKGLVDFPSGSPISYSNLKVITLTATGQVNSDGSFELDAPIGYYSHVFVVDKMSNATVAAVYDSAASNIRIDPITTAKAILMMFPIDWAAIGYNPGDVLERIPASSHWNDYLTMTTNLMSSDPMALMDYVSHPKLLETAALVINDMAAGMVKKMEDSQYNSAYLLDDAGEKIKVQNPKATPYGISVYNLQGPPIEYSAYYLSKTPLYVNGWDFDYWIFANEGEAEYELGYGDFVCVLSKPDIMYLTSLGISPVLGPIVLSAFRQQELSRAITAGDYIQVLKTDALIKSYMGAQLTLLIRSLNIISVLDPTELSGIAGATLKHGPEFLDLSQRIMLGGEDWISAESEYTVTTLLQCLISSLKISIDAMWVVIEEWAFEDGYILNISAEYLKVNLENLSVIIDVLDGIENGALLLGFGYDMLTADSYVVYMIHKDGIQNQIIQTFPPTIPTVSGILPSIMYGSELNITLRSEDPEGKLIQYWLYKNPYSLLKSEWVPSGSEYTFSFTPSTMGDYHMTACSMDLDGAMSGPVSITCTVSAGQSFFHDGFESWNQGKFETNEIWTVDYYLPSEVRIVNQASKGSHSVQLIDFDPYIGDVYGYYAGLYTYVNGNPGQVEFDIRIDEPQDEFGIRTWQIPGDFNTLAYYLAVMNGQLHWVQFAMNPDDPQDFMPFMSLNAGQWYHIKLLIDWPNGTYDICVNDQPMINDARFVQDLWSGQHVTSAPCFQAVAFIETQCRSAYLDEVLMEGVVLSSLPRNLAPPELSEFSLMKNRVK